MNAFDLGLRNTTAVFQLNRQSDNFHRLAVILRRDQFLVRRSELRRANRISNALNHTKTTREHEGLDRRLHAIAKSIGAQMALQTSKRMNQLSRDTLFVFDQIVENCTPSATP